MSDSMVINSLADLALRTVLVAAAVWFLLRFSAKSAAGFRHVTWTTTLLILLILPVSLAVWNPNHFLLEREQDVVRSDDSGTTLSYLVGSDSATGESSATRTDGRGSPVHDVGSDPITAVRELSANRMGAEEPELATNPVVVTVKAPETETRDWLAYAVLGLWLLGSVVLAFSWLRAGLGIRELMKSVEQPRPELLKLIRRVARLTGFKKTISVHVTAELHVPAVTGFFRPRLFVPESLLDSIDEEFFATLMAHEIIHLRRHDPLVQSLSRLTICIYWFNPFVWLARRALEADRELLTDAAVVDAQENRAPYAEGLLRVLQRENGIPWQPSVALGLFDGSSIGDRMRRIIDGELVKSASAGLQVLAVLITCSLGLMVSDMALAGASVKAEPAGVPLKQDEEKVSATIRVRIIPTASREAGKAYAVKDKRLDAAELKTVLGKYSVDHNAKYDDGHGLSSTRILVEGSKDDLGDEMASLMKICADLKIYLIEVATKKEPRAEPLRKPLLVNIGRNGEVKIDGEGLFYPGEDSAILQDFLHTYMKISLTDSVLICASTGTPVSYLTPVMDIARRAGAKTIQFAVDDSAAVNVDDAFVDKIRDEVAKGPKTFEQINHALDYLASQQQPDGRISERRKKASSNDQGRTALAVLAFLGTGHSHRVGAYQEVVNRALKFLMLEQQENGFLGEYSGVGSVYGHAISGLALTEAYAQSKDLRLKPVIQAALNYSLSAQNPYQAWRYQPANGENDSSVTTWMLMFLKSAESAGFEVPKTRFDWALDFLKEMMDPKTGRVGYVRRGDLPPQLISAGSMVNADSAPVEPTTAMATFVRGLCGVELDDGSLRRGRSLLLAKPPVWSPDGEGVDFFYWYFGSLATYQGGGEGWDCWELRLRHALNQAQTRSGPEAGSWDSNGRFGVESGRVATTALAVLALEVCHHHESLKSGEKGK